MFYIATLYMNLYSILCILIYICIDYPPILSITFCDEIDISDVLFCSIYIVCIRSVYSV